MASSSSSSPDKEKNVLALLSMDGQCFEITRSEAAQSVLLKNMVEEGSNVSDNNMVKNSVTLHNVNSSTLAMVTEYLKKHANSQVSEEDKDKYDLEEISTKPLADLLHIFLAADYLEIKGLLDVMAKTIAYHIKDFSVEKVREIFNIENDFTPEEEEKLRQEHPWVYDIQPDSNNN